jgi:hypothetical protein
VVYPPYIKPAVLVPAPYEAIRSVGQFVPEDQVPGPCTAILNFPDPELYQSRPIFSVVVGSDDKFLTE